MLGISVYPDKQELNKIIEYIEFSSKLGYKRIFMSLLALDKDYENEISKYKEVITFANKCNMEVTLDVAPNLFKLLNISYDDLSFFKNIGAKSIRLDEGFDGLKESQLTYNKHDLNIEINMSNGTKYLDNIISFHPNKQKLIGSHNFYPQEYTGLKYDHFVKCTLNFKKFNINTAAFVNSQIAKIGPWPIMDGLCTLEMHRHLPLITQVKHLIIEENIDDIIIANAFASKEELKSVADIYFNKKLKINFLPSSSISEIESKICYEEEHFNRGDVSEYLIRSTQSRVKYKNNDIPPQKSCPKILKKGDIVIFNNNGKNYKGELQIILKDQKNIELRKNLIGKISEEEMFLIDLIKPWSKFQFN